MKPDEKEIDALVKALSLRHGLKFDELVKQSKKLATYIKGLDNFHFVHGQHRVQLPPRMKQQPHCSVESI